jgi:hypothetical protein
MTGCFIVGGELAADGKGYERFRRPRALLNIATQYLESDARRAGRFTKRRGVR